MGFDVSDGDLDEGYAFILGRILGDGIEGHTLVVGMYGGCVYTRGEVSLDLSIYPFEVTLLSHKVELTLFYLSVDHRIRMCEL